MTDPSARRRRWALTVLVGVLVAVGCVAAGVWQWHRHEQRAAAVDLVESNHDAEPVPVDALLAVGQPLDPRHAWRPVEVVGHYVDPQVLVRNRPVSGSPALHVVAPLVVDEGPLTGAVLLVDRGWVPPGDDGSGPTVADAPPGRTTLVARLRPLEAPSSRDAPAGQVQAISVPDVERALGGGPLPGPALGAYGTAVTEDGARPVGVAPLPRPATTLGTNMSYAFQWWVFAVGALAAPVLLIRREQRDGEQAAADNVVEPGAAVPPAGDVARRAPTRRQRRRPTAEEEEDALLDAQASGDVRVDGS
ncbi:SURF1 family cytochrome oxidase biogenesis protein [Cellulomonas carbonis]|uniref:SURF1-like protein n=1 Tax=Cellulomonas carbonis T26 TaxID=947969 RepID=A0A0A0BUZ9_9CELL|nr:SURF1 family protein [Cellulomonas carbonis]KGM12213.1 hypothetical protein N868_00885 [Cellulomonas carbonis T26]GGB96445.1 hypothetical protein GCM10010972_06460 [Cellulomonas carbonis]